MAMTNFHDDRQLGICRHELLLNALTLRIANRGGFYVYARVDRRLSVEHGKPARGFEWSEINARYAQELAYLKPFEQCI